MAELRSRRVAVAALVPTAVLLQVWAVSAPPVAVLAVVAGAYLQTQRRYNAARQQRAADLEREREQRDLLAAHQERAMIARELHDIVAHSVTVMLLGVRGAHDVLRTDPSAAAGALTRVETSGEQSLAELRRMLALLRAPDRGSPAELAPAPSLEGVEELAAQFRDAGLPVTLEVAGCRRPLPVGVELSVYRIVEQALTNAATHTRPKTVLVRLQYGSDTLGVSVEDDGQPPHTAERSNTRGGHGLLGMRERAEALGGQFAADARPGGGFRVAATLPIEPAA